MQGDFCFFFLTGISFILNITALPFSGAVNQQGSFATQLCNLA